MEKSVEEWRRRMCQDVPLQPRRKSKLSRREHLEGCQSRPHTRHGQGMNRRHLPLLTESGTLLAVVVSVLLFSCSSFRKDFPKVVPRWPANQRAQTGVFRSQRAAVKSQISLSRLAKSVNDVIFVPPTRTVLWFEVRDHHTMVHQDAPPDVHQDPGRCK